MQAVTADPYPPDEAASLLARIAGHDAVAFRRLYDIHSRLLYGIALRITRNPALASDAVHDALLQVWRNAARFDPARGHALAWLVTLVRYRALDLVARTRCEVQDDGSAPGSAASQLVDPAPHPLERLHATAEGQQLRRCLDAEDPDRRNLVILAFVEGLTHPEVAARVRQPLGTVKSAIRRTLLRLRDCLGEARA